MESIYLAPGGPVATYSSSAWINGVLNGRLMIDIFEDLLIDRPATLGEWVGQVEVSSHPISDSHALFTWALSGIIPRISSAYEHKLFLSPSDARQVVAIQHASYNLFGDPALQIAYPQPGIDLTSYTLWRPWPGPITVSGRSNLPAGQRISISIETLPGNIIKQEKQIDGVDRYLRANDPMVETVLATVKSDGSFSTNLNIPSGTPSGQYLLRVISTSGNQTISSAVPIYLGWAGILEALSSKVFWWLFTSVVLLFIKKMSGAQTGLHPSS